LVVKSKACSSNRCALRDAAAANFIMNNPV
jgi:hypothetical protein